MFETNEKLHRKEHRILVVEDESIVRNFTQSALLRDGYTVFTAKTGKEAQDLFKKEEGSFHLVLSDIHLPDIKGIKLAEEFRLKNPLLKIIVSSGYLYEELRNTEIQNKQVRFLQKPYDLEELLCTVNDILVNRQTSTL